jgi:hypothetical protein
VHLLQRATTIAQRNQRASRIVRVTIILMTVNAIMDITSQHMKISVSSGGGINNMMNNARNAKLKKRHE